MFSCVPSSEALDEVVQGPNGLVHSARPGQIVVELGSHPVAGQGEADRAACGKGRGLLDGEVSGTPGMVSARKAVIYLGGDAEACKKVERVVAGFADSCLYFGAVRRREQGQARQQSPGRHQYRRRPRRRWRSGSRPASTVDLMIKAIATGSGGSTQFGIRAPWMAQQRNSAGAGHAVPTSAHYFDMIDDLADSVGAATPMLDRAIELYACAFIADGFRRARRRRDGRRHRIAAALEVI